MNLQDLKRLNEQAERKCKRGLLYFALLCILIFIAFPIGMVVTVNYAEEIDLFFNFKTQVITFLTMLLCLAGLLLYRWWRQ